MVNDAARTAKRAARVALACIFIGCAPDVARGTGGTDRQPGACGRGLVVVSSDYQSSSVALVDTRGASLSPRFLSSASADVGLSSALSGDVVLPTSAALGSELVVIDRYPASVLSVVDVATGSVRAQLDVRTGFASNPQDFLGISSNAGWVSRYGSNPTPGGEPFDEGGDLLLLDLSRPAIEARLDLAPAMRDAPGFLPRPGRMVALGDLVFVLLSAYDVTFASSAPSRLAAFDGKTRALRGVRVLEGLHGCSALALEPPYAADAQPLAARRLAVGCSGEFAGGASPSLARAGIALFQANDAMTELARFMAEDLVDRPIGFDLDFDERGGLVAVGFGSLDGPGPSTDALFRLDLETGAVAIVATTASRPFELGGVRCIHRRFAVDPSSGAGSACTEACYVADGERGALLRLEPSGEGMALTGELSIGDGVGLPPRVLEIF